MEGYKNKVALVTGASGGLGRAFCLVLAKSGAMIVAFDQDAAALDILERDLQEIGSEHIIFAGDITDVEDTSELARRVAANFGRLDLLIHNAGVTSISRFEDSGPEVTARVMNINFIGAVTLTYELLPMIKKSAGSIVAMSSVAGFAPLFARSAYAASKHAMHGFFESLRSELVDDGVHIMMVCPSFIATQAETRAADDVSQDGLSRPGSAKENAGNPMTPEYVADKILRAAVKKKRLLVIGRIAKLSWIISHLFPAFYEKKMIESTKGELE